MLVGRLSPEATSHTLFRRDSAIMIPEAPGCYVLVTQERVILYVGQAVNINRRVEDHLASDDKRNRTPWGYVRWVFYRLCDVSELSDLESIWVQQFKLANRGNLPYFNKVEPPSR